MVAKQLLCGGGFLLGLGGFSFKLLHAGFQVIPFTVVRNEDSGGAHGALGGSGAVQMSAGDSSRGKADAAFEGHGLGLHGCVVLGVGGLPGYRQCGDSSGLLQAGAHAFGECSGEIVQIHVEVVGGSAQRSRGGLGNLTACGFFRDRLVNEPDQ